MFGTENNARFRIIRAISPTKISGSLTCSSTSIQMAQSHSPSAAGKPGDSRWTRRNGNWRRNKMSQQYAFASNPSQSCPAAMSLGPYAPAPQPTSTTEQPSGKYSANRFETSIPGSSIGGPEPVSYTHLTLPTSDLV